MFHRKVHPENSAAEPKNECKKKTINVDGGHNKFEALIAKESNKSQSNPVLQFSLGIEDSSENREHWIKTDSDCKQAQHYSRYRTVLQMDFHEYA